MCLGIPGKVIEIDGDSGYVEFGAVKRKVNLKLLAEVNVGDYVLVHTGFAIEKIDREEAEKTLKLFQDISISFDEIR